LGLVEQNLAAHFVKGVQLRLPAKRYFLDGNPGLHLLAYPVRPHQLIEPIRDLAVLRVPPLEMVGNHVAHDLDHLESRFHGPEDLAVQHVGLHSAAEFPAIVAVPGREVSGAENHPRVIEGVERGRPRLAINPGSPFQFAWPGSPQSQRQVGALEETTARIDRGRVQAGAVGGGHAEGHGGPVSIEAGPHVLNVKDQHVHTLNHCGSWLLTFAEQAVDRYARVGVHRRVHGHSGLGVAAHAVLRPI